MSSRRRKSSTPCMIRVSDPPMEEQEEQQEEQQQEDSEEMEVSTTDNVAENGSSSSSESTTGDRDGQTLDAQDSVEEDGDLGSDEKVVAETETETDPSPAGRRQQQQQQQGGGGGGGGYACKYCPFSTQSLSDFKEHVDSSHPNVILNPQYLCAVCNFSTKKFDTLTEHNETRHPGESNFKFKRVRTDSNQTVLEQTIEGKDNPVAECDSSAADGGGGGQEGNESCTPALPLPSKPTAAAAAAAKIGKPKTNNVQQNQQCFLYRGNDSENQLENLIPKDQITAVNINGGTVITVPEPSIYQTQSHVMPLLQRPPNFNSVPKIAVPLNTTKYNPSLDNNTTLMTSFNKFPYPTHAELSWLTAASKHPEGQIKVWFTTQRLKQGITWSPDEVEEARKKMFNGSIPPVHQTFTVLPNPYLPRPNPHPFTQPAKAAQPFITTSTFGQSNLVLTSSFNGSTNGSAVTCTPVAAMAVVNPVQAIKRPLTTPTFAPDLKRPMMASPAEDPTNEKRLMAPPPAPHPKERLPMAPPPVPPEIKRSVALSLIASEMKRSSAAPLMASKGKLPSAAPLVMPKSKMAPMALSPVFPGMKRSLVPPPPIVAPQFKNYMLPPSLTISEDKLSPVTHSLLAPELKLRISPPLIAPQIRRPTIIQSVRTPLMVPSQVPSFPSDCKKTKEQTTELKAGHVVRGLLLSHDKALTPLGEATNGVHDQISAPAHNGIIQLYSGALSPQKHEQQQKSVPTQFPLLERMKGKTSEQLKILEENFQRNSFPAYRDVDNLATATRLSREEIDSWFSERRALRDNLEQALLNSMGSKRLNAERRLLQLQHNPLNGAHKQPSAHPRSPPPLPIVAPTACSVPGADGRSLGLLKDVFAQTLWPSPEDYSRLEVQTGLARAEIVRWFKDNRLALKSGTLEWMELFHKMNNNNSSGGGTQQNGQGGAPLLSTEQNAFGTIQQRCREGKMSHPKVVEDIGRLTEQRSPDSSQEMMKDRFRPTKSVMKNGGGQNGGLKEGFGGSLMEETTKRMDAPMGAQELVSDQVVEEDASGRVTG